MTRRRRSRGRRGRGRGRPPEPPRVPEPEWCPHCDRHVIAGAPASHNEECPRYQEPETYCSICNPRPDEHRYHGLTGTGGPVYCEKHDRDDWQARIEHETEPRDEAMKHDEERYKTEFENRTAGDDR